MSSTRARHAGAAGPAAIVSAGLVAIGLLASAPAFGAGAVFAPSDQSVEIRSVLAAYAVTQDALTLRIGLELTGTSTRVIWVLPLPQPAVRSSLAPADALDAMEAQTSMQVELPRSDPCPIPSRPTDKSTGCACGDGAPPPAAAPVTPIPAPQAVVPRTRHASGRASTFEVQLLAPLRTDALIQRLRDAGVFVSDALRPRLEAEFRTPTPALLLDATSPAGPRRLPVVELVFDPATEMRLPLALTAATAAPRLDLRVFILADAPYLSENWVGVVARPEELLHDAAGHLSYAPWVARASADGTARVLVTEATVATADGVLSRFYARPSVEQLDLDPIFRPHPQLDFRVEPVLNLSPNPSLQECAEIVLDRLPVDCGFHYCGPRSECLILDAQVACRCPEGSAGTVLEEPDGVDRITCAPLVLERAPTQSEPPDLVDPCVNLDCGSLGECVQRGGRALCDCESGAAATLMDGALTCIVAPADAPAYGPGGGRESRVMALRAATMSTLSLVILFALFAVSRRRQVLGILSSCPNPAASSTAPTTSASTRTPPPE